MVRHACIQPLTINANLLNPAVHMGKPFPSTFFHFGMLLCVFKHKTLSFWNVALCFEAQKATSLGQSQTFAQQVMCRDLLTCMIDLFMVYSECTNLS